MASELSTLIRAINSMGGVMREVVKSNQAVVSAIQSTNETLNIGMQSSIPGIEVPNSLGVPHGTTKYDIDAKRAKVVAKAKSTIDILPEAVRDDISDLSDITESISGIGAQIQSISSDLKESSNQLLHTLAGTAEYHRTLNAAVFAVTEAKNTLRSSIFDVAGVIKSSSDSRDMVREMADNLSKAVEAVRSASDGLSFNLTGTEKQVDAMTARVDKVDEKTFKRGLEIKEEIEACSAEIREYMAPMLRKVKGIEDKLSGIMSGGLKLDSVNGETVTAGNRRKK